MKPSVISAFILAFLSTSVTGAAVAASPGQVSSSSGHIQARVLQPLVQGTCQVHKDKHRPNRCVGKPCKDHWYECFAMDNNENDWVVPCINQCSQGTCYIDKIRLVATCR
ncbi:hypothetical protein BDV28DRAFT_106952 [Aspergillus coremiiformis]|uniref:Uncharacterized protein n=1 Tax=Aspergillus coremiiformis TaxID=138285 RepID=A0A5N6ZBM2_9EURO|nr:hypothetical protein BDV28DRAFT_106952 [Aspergillus coremiiformis]